MKISIITPTFNSEKNIYKNISSVSQQTYKNWEQIIIDNNSTDNTLSIVNKFNEKKIKIVKEKDEGIFDAINKGIINSSGEIISILHSDDFYHDNNVLNLIVEKFQNVKSDIIYGNIIYVAENTEKKILRYWKSGPYKKGLFLKGWSPPHTAFIVKRSVHEKYGYYDKKLGNSADFELMYRLLEKNQCHSNYIDKIMVTMRYGGESNKDLIKIIKQNLVILKILNINSRPIKLIKFLFLKGLNRIKQLIYRPI